jgi:Fe-S oxidoreductase
VLHRACIDFGILYDSEQNSGNDIRRTGAESVFLELSAKNRRAIQSARFETIFTTDPHSYNTLKNEYEWNGRRPGILHFTELMEQIFRAGKLPLKREVKGTVTYQDPCFLGRYNGVYEPARRVLDQLGLNIVEMPRNRAAAACCGAGGGRIWTSRFRDGVDGPAEIRVREADSLRVAPTIVTTCPKDLLMLRVALRSTRLDERLQVKDLAELLDDASRPAHASDGGRLHQHGTGL